jgi:hypothetical protein
MRPPPSVEDPERRRAEVERALKAIGLGAILGAILAWLGRARRAASGSRE